MFSSSSSVVTSPASPAPTTTTSVRSASGTRAPYRGRVQSTDERRRFRPGPRQPDRGAHRLQRRARAAVRDRAGCDCASDTTARPARGREGPRSRGRDRRASTLPPSTTTAAATGRTSSAARSPSSSRRATSSTAPSSKSRATSRRAAVCRHPPPSRCRSVWRCSRSLRSRSRTTAPDSRACALVWRTSGSARRPACSISSRPSYGEPGHALRIDFRSLEVRPVPLRLNGWTLATVASGEEHSLADPESGYGERRRECEEACERLGLATLRAARPEQLDALPAPLDRRARHVLEENERVEQTISAARARRSRPGGGASRCLAREPA